MTRHGFPTYWRGNRQKTGRAGRLGKPHATESGEMGWWWERKGGAGQGWSLHPYWDSPGLCEAYWIGSWFCPLASPATLGCHLWIAILHLFLLASLVPTQATPCSLLLGLPPKRDILPCRKNKKKAAAGLWAESQRSGQTDQFGIRLITKHGPSGTTTPLRFGLHEENAIHENQSKQMSDITPCTARSWVFSFCWSRY